LVGALRGSEVRELREHRLHQPVDVPALGSIVELVAVRACDLLPGELLDRCDGDRAAGMEDRAEDGRHTGVEELDVPLAPSISGVRRVRPAGLEIVGDHFEEPRDVEGLGQVLSGSELFDAVCLAFAGVGGEYDDGDLERPRV
jgi:hypothetical protein